MSDEPILIDDEPIVSSETTDQTKSEKPLSIYEQQVQALLNSSYKNTNKPPTPPNDHLAITIENTNLSPALSELNKTEFRTVKNRIIKEIVVPNYYKDIKDTIVGRKLWRNASNKAELFSKLLTGAATIVAFAAGAYTDYTYLSFIAGCIGTGAMVSQQFSTYAKGEAKERTEQANTILKIMGIDSIPNLEEDN